MQGDLFGMPTMASQANPAGAKNDFLERYRVTLRLDQALVGAIGLLVVYVLIFSFGVEKGKRLGMAELQAERTKHERVMRELGGKLFSAATIAEKTFPVKAEVKIETPVPLPASVAAESDVFESSAPSRPVGKYTIQLITFKSQSAVDREIKKLSEKGYQGFVIPSGSFLQVCVNGFQTRQEANRILSELKSRQLAAKDAYVRPLPQA